ncbi:MAG TPA: DNA translocase FtsK [Blastocatellia bacterium]|nr:DNA translocase FtsK [Blastocatellia bacterium]
MPVDPTDNEPFFPPLSAAKPAVPMTEKRAVAGQVHYSQTFRDALRACVRKRRASVSVLQSALGVGLEDAIELLSILEEKGFISPPEGDKPHYLKNLAFETVALWDAEDKATEKDEKYDEALRIVIEMGRASTSVLQRRLRIGEKRAAALIDAMYRNGIVGPADDDRPRSVLVGDAYLDRL